MDQVDQRGFDNQRSDYLSAAEAVRLLGVKRATLYAYVSRGLVRSVPGRKGRGHQYSRSDLERLRTRVQARAGHGPVAAGALRFGEPVLVTAISSIEPSGPHYRGESAVALANGGVPYEAVAELLWSGDRSRGAAWPVAETKSRVERIARRLRPGEPPLYTMLAAAPQLALLDGARFASPPEAEWSRARTLLRSLAALTALSYSPARALPAAGKDSVAAVLARALGAKTTATPAIDRILVLCADHELNASTFAARVVASTGADLYACITAALSAMTGPRHGGASDRVEALVDEVESPRRAAAVVDARAERGEAMPGYGHRLYPGGDPRVPPLLEIARRGAKSRRLATLLAIDAAMKRARRGYPNLDFGLVAAVHALSLPRGAAAVLFAVGRIAGWVAHALEQRESGHLLRPRAEYVPRPPSDVGGRSE